MVEALPLNLLHGRTGFLFTHEQWKEVFERHMRQKKKGMGSSEMFDSVRVGCDSCPLRGRRVVFRASREWLGRLSSGWWNLFLLEGQSHWVLTR